LTRRQNGHDPNNRLAFSRFFSSLLVEAHKLRPVTAMVQLLSGGRDLSTEQQLNIEGALLQGDALSAENLPVLKRLLDDWEASLAGVGEGASRRRKK
jgi:hypothetical protein